MRPPTPLPAELSTRAFAVGEALRAGAKEGRLRGRDLARPFHGVRMPAQEPPTFLERCQAKLVTMRPGDVFSHATAAALHGIVLPRRVREAIVEEIDVAGFAPRAIPRGRGVRGHRLASGGTEVGLLAGLPIVSPEDAWCQLATLVTVRELVVAGDSLLRRHAPRSSLDALGRALRRHAGRRGHRALAAAFPLLRANTDSPQETLLRLDLRDAGLPEPRVNYAVTDASGRLIAIADLAYPEYRVMPEYDGDQHRTDDRQYARDIHRHDELAAEGWRAIRFTKRHRGAARVARIEEVRLALRERGWTGSIGT
ncbi:DUF559 domain-containing protein [Agromyces sp. G08B096]|uniref:DUF559 domain-containing protein n=1 Tax=Agromyces sp. G08B096 TaxID=3156399 RepID=A0AAU7W8C2_9MICO